MVKPQRNPPQKIKAYARSLNDWRAACRSIENSLRSSTTDDQPLMLCIAKIGGLLAISETVGHEVSDNLMDAVESRIRGLLNRSDILVRLDADQFVIVRTAPGLASSNEALISEICEFGSRSYLLNRQLFDVSVDAGVAFSQASGELSQLLQHARAALRHAQSQGSGTFAFFEPSMRALALARRELEADLRRALALRELSLMYQPQVNLASGEVTGFEALLRWDHPKRGRISPADFIPLAEETGLIVPIGAWVIRTACNVASSWPASLHVAVNVSALQMKQSLIQTVISALAESGLAPRRLELEVTESVLIGNNLAATEVLGKLRELGVSIAMDDFGTGYSSLGYLRTFPFDKIKIDQSFVRESSNSPSGKAIVRAIASLAAGLSMKCTAEGVETTGDAERITADGCTEMQGYLVSKPMVPDQIGDFLSNYQLKKDSTNGG